MNPLTPNAECMLHCSTVRKLAVHMLRCNKTRESTQQQGTILSPPGLLTAGILKLVACCKVDLQHPCQSSTCC